MSFLSLKIFKNSQLLKTKIFTDDQVSIGSSEGLTLQLEGISPWHVLIEKKKDIFSILDLNSEMGTLLDGKKITDETPLSSGSVVTLGPYEIHFFIGPPTEEEATKSPQFVEDKASSKIPSFEKDSPSGRGVKKTTVVKKSFDTRNISQGKSSKPLKKGFWNTYAPPSKIKNLDEFLQPSIGNLIEVVVCWKERVLSTYHFYEGGDVFMGFEKNCQIKAPAMKQGSYKLLSVASGAKIHIDSSLKATLFQGQNKSTRTSKSLNGLPNVILKPYEMVRLDFPSSLTVYIRLMEKSSKAPLAGLLNLRVSESMALFLAFLLTGLLLFYGSLYAPAFLRADTKFIEKEIRRATVIFKKEPVKIVEYQLTDRTTRERVTKKRPTLFKKKPSVKTVKKRKRSRKKNVRTTPRKGKVGKMAGQAPGKKTKKRKQAIGSVRPGGSLKTGKKGASAKTVTPDPTKVGLLGVFGGGGRLKNLDKGAEGSGALLGLAEQATGYGGTEEAYGGEGVGTKTKDLGAGGQGKALVGLSGIKTKGKGFGTVGTGTGGLGKRGQMRMDFGDEDIDVAGEIDRNAILRVIRRNQSKFQLCYQVSLNDKPSAQGNLSMEWFISSAGKGQRAKSISNKVGSDYLANCVARVLNRLNFPAPPSGQMPKVRFTFRFYL